ncbi:MAG: 2-oxo-4-hydroxy-4-carboxy-5-ureidoimidazoline decarboxylase [Rhizobiales bacterium]|nr:2-oxo-4-hydroxy-4-carboxy-5-ureidoimidazoline decarboxylase [Hyphomicrobiales bacterium]
MGTALRSGLELVNSADRDKFVALLGDVFENSPWIAEDVLAYRPFRSLDELHRAMMRCVHNAPQSRQLRLIRAHPELAGREATKGTMTTDSTSEQGRLGFTTLTHAELLEISELNRRYRDKFGFPCIIALRLHEKRDSVMAEMARRIGNDAVTEIANALQQIGHITRGRLAKIMGGT